MARLSNGTNIDEFTDFQYVAKGGFGHVYKAIDKSGNQVAVKQLDSPSREPLDKSDFEREAKILKGISPSGWFPDFVKFWQEDSSNDFSFFLAMEWIEGDTLHEIIQKNIQKGSFPNPKNWLEFMISCLQGLEYIHTPDQGKMQEWEDPIIHRDIKPKNIKVVKSGVNVRGVILDIGAGRFLTQDVSSATVREVTSRVATGAWESPESAILNKVYTVSDIYSFGLSLYVLLTGEIPVMPFMFSKENLDSSSDFYDMNPARFEMKHWNSKVDQALQDIIYKMCCMKRADRWQSAREAIKALEDWAGQSAPSQQQSIAIAPSSAPQSAQQQRRKVVIRRPQQQQSQPGPATVTSPTPTPVVGVKPIVATPQTQQHKICDECGGVVQGKNCCRCGAGWTPGGKTSDKICPKCKVLAGKYCGICGEEV